MKVSVIIAAYNVETFVSRAIASVQAQTHRNWEIIVVDDASTDGTAAMVEAIARDDGRVRLLRRQPNGGPAAARNKALDAATGEWVAVIDADDAWRPERLERLLAAAMETESDFVADNQILLDDALQHEVGTAFDPAQARFRMTVRGLCHGDYEGTIVNLGMLKPLIRLAFLNSRKLRYRSDLRYFEDYHFHAELIFNGVSAICIPEPLYIYTMPVGTVSRVTSLGTRTTGYIPTRFPIVDALVAKYKHVLPRDMKPLLRRYWAIARRRWVSNRITSLRKDGDPLSLACFMLAHPVGTAAYMQRSRTFRMLKRTFAK